MGWVVVEVRLYFCSGCSICTIMFLYADESVHTLASDVRVSLPAMEHVALVGSDLVACVHREEDALVSTGPLPSRVSSAVPAVANGGLSVVTEDVGAAQSMNATVSSMDMSNGKCIWFRCGSCSIEVASAMLLRYSLLWLL